MITVLFPTDMEARPFLERLEGAAPAAVGRRRGMSGRVGRKNVTAIVTGVGQANAAQAVTAAMEALRPVLVIMGGCAGAYEGRGVKVGDVAAATEEEFADTGVMAPDGWKGMEETGIPLLEADGMRHFNRLPLSSEDRHKI